MDNINENKKNKIKMQNERIGTENSNPFNNNNKNIINISDKNMTLFPSTDNNSSEEEVTISPIKLMITSASSKTTIIEPACKLEKFLPPLNILNQNKKTLVLDLDETLIHSYFDHQPPRKPDISFDIFIDKKKIHVNSILRPGVHEFLDNLENLYEIIIFTASLSQYANPVLDFIDKKGICKFRLFREHCCCYTNGFSNSFIKDLKKLDRDMKNLIIIDNNPKSFMLNKENGVPIKTWVEDVNDKELFKLIPYLIFLGNEKVLDVRPFLKEINSGSSLNYEKFDKIISEYNIKKEEELNKINLENINQNIFDSINVDIGSSINKEKENKKNKEVKNKKENHILNDKNEKLLINKKNKENEPIKIINEDNNEIKNKSNKENIIKENNNKEIKNKITNSKNIINNNESKKNEKENNNQNIKKENENNKAPLEKKDKNVINKFNKKENIKTNILKRNENVNKELIDISKRNNSANNKDNIIKFNYNQTKNKTITDSKNNTNERYDYSIKEEDLLIDEYNSFDDKNINDMQLIKREVTKNVKLNNSSNTSRETMAISLNKISNERNNFFLKKSSFLNTYINNKIRDESDNITLQNSNYNKSNELLKEIIKNMNKNSSIETKIKINKSIQNSEQEKTIINDDLNEEEKNINNENDEQIFDYIETEKNDANNEKSKSLEKEELNNDENNEKKYECNTLAEKESYKRKKRKINKNLFNRGKINKYIQKNDKDKETSNKFLINLKNNKNISNNNINEDNNNIKEQLKEKPDYLAKKKFVKDIFNYSTRRKRENIQNNISSYNYKIFKEKDKPNLFLKNKSNINNDAINLFVSRTKSMSKHGSNLFDIRNKLNCAKSNKNKLYIMKKEKEGLIILSKNKDNSLKNSGFTIRPSSCVNKNHEGILSTNKRIIRFTKQDKKIYLKRNNEKKNEIKKTRINIENINNMGVNLDKSLKNEKEETKENKKIKRNMIIDFHDNPTRNIITDIFFVKNLEERNNTNINADNVSELIDTDKNKLIQNYNKAALL